MPRSGGWHVVGALVAIGCATPPKPHDVQTTEMVNADFESIWSALVDVFAGHNWSIGHIDKASGLITTEWIALGDKVERLADCGSAPLARDNGAQVRFNVHVTPAGERSVITVNTAFRQFRAIADLNNMQECVSTGSLEMAIQSETLDRARKRTKPKDVGERNVVHGDRLLFCAARMSEPDIGVCTFDEQSCIDERGRTGDMTPCETRQNAACFNASVVLDEKRLTICAVSVKDCEAKRSAKAADPDYTHVSPRCGVYRVDRAAQGSAERDR